MRFSPLLCVAVLCAAACTQDPSTATPPSSRPSVTPPWQESRAPSATPVRSFDACLRSHGVRLSEKNGEPEGDPVLIRKGIERCASLLGGTAVRIPVAPDSRFQTCLAEHGVKLPPAGEWLRIDPREPAMARALRSCA